MSLLDQSRGPAAPSDGCPNCLRRYNDPRWSVFDDRTGTLYGDYKCYGCGHVWWTGWDPDVLPDWRDA